MTQGRSSNFGQYPGRPLDFGASIGGAGAGALWSNASYGVGAGALQSPTTPGSFYMLASPLVLSSAAFFVFNLAAPGDLVTLRIYQNNVAVRTLVVAYDDGIAAPAPGGRYVALTFDPLVVEANDRIALYWPNLGTDPVLPGLITGFLQ